MSSGEFSVIVGRMERRDAAHVEEAKRIELLRRGSIVPAGSGPNIIGFAPARGPVREFRDPSCYLNGEGDVEVLDRGNRHSGLIAKDVFDVMADQAAKHGSPPPFASAQIGMARFYRTLVEKHTAAGVKCSSIEGQRGGSGGDGGFMDAVLQDRDKIDVIRRRIGSGSAMIVRRQRPSTRGSRASILDRRLVDAVCLEECSISDVLRAHGWSIYGKAVTALTLALRDALDRMMGPEQKKNGVISKHYGAESRFDWGHAN